jgi:uncharacterized SAM-binding protein YcdF (DUF218 family)
MYDCIIILGGGVSINNILPEWSLDRCNYVLELFKKNKDVNIICTSGGSYHNPNPLDDNRHTIHECDTFAKYLINNGIPENKIFKEWCSYDTIGNAYFTKLLLVDVFKWNKILVVTSDFHMDRSKVIFDYIFKENKYSLSYYSCIYKTNHQYLESRINKEKKSLLNFQNLINSLNSFEDFHKWIYTNHQCYVSNQKKKEHLQDKMLYN